jgi:hypothetical protein
MRSDRETAFRRIQHPEALDIIGLLHVCEAFCKSPGALA